MSTAKQKQKTKRTKNSTLRKLNLTLRGKLIAAFLFLALIL
jgi:hypothetical protein